MPYWKVSSRVKKFRSGSRIPYYIYTLTSLTSVQEKVKVHSFRKYAPRAGDHWLWACCFYELLGLSTFLNYKRKLKRIFIQYIYFIIAKNRSSNWEIESTQLENKNFPTGKNFFHS